ncbi:hypothetical protein ACFQH8_15980 [Halomicroarcula sp. GCM10025710]
MRQNESLREVSLGKTPADLPLAAPCVKLTDQQLQDARGIAYRRSRSYESIDGGQVHGEQSYRDAHLTGVVGELAVAQLYDGRIDRDVYEHGDEGHDLIFGRTTFDVKTTKTTALSRPDLIVPVDPTPIADYYFLTHWVEEHRVRVIGYASRGTVLDREPRRFPGETLNYVVPPTELQTPGEYNPRNALKTFYFSREK